MSRIDSISKALEAEHGIDLSSGKIVKVDSYQEENVIEEAQVFPIENINNSTNIIDIDDDSQENIVDEESAEYKEDEELVKNNIRELIRKSMDLADDMFEIVRISESAKSFEPASSYLKTIVEMNEKLLDIHERKNKKKGNKDIAKSDTPTVNNTQNNTILCKDPAELLKIMLNKE